MHNKQFPSRRELHHQGGAIKPSLPDSPSAPLENPFDTLSKGKFPLSERDEAVTVKTDTIDHATEEISASGFERFHDSDVTITEIAEHEVEGLDTSEEIDKTFEDIIFSEDGEGRYKKINKAAKIVAIVVAVLAVLSLIGYAVMRWYEDQFAIVPQALNVSMIDDPLVCEPFEELEIECSAVWQFSSLPSGDLIEQSIPAGEKVKVKETEIQLSYSKGPEDIVVPNFEGLDLDVAKELAEEAGLEVGEVTEEDAEGISENVVISASIEPETLVKNGDTIDFVVSSGLYKVPDWIGKPSEVVMVEASEMGLDITFLEQEDAGPSGIVLSQSLEPGSESRDRALEVTVSKSKVIEEAEIPDIINASADDAQVALAAAGFTKIKMVEVPSSAPSGVFQTVPGVGQSAPLSETIVIIVTVSEE